MQKIVDPKQTRLFDPFDSVLTEKTRKRLLDGWAGVFRHIILELLPVDTLCGHFTPEMGRPTKELYSMAGLILLMEFMDWTKQDALDAYSFRMDIHYALNMEPVTHDLSIRTLERYLGYFEHDELSRKIMHKVTTKLVAILGINIDRQRLDSTHIFSDMASFGRTRLMGVAIKRFLTQVKRGNEGDYAALDEQLRRRYAPGVHQLFGETGKDNESRRLLRQQVAEDMYQLIRHFADMPDHAGRDTYKALERIFYEQCEVHNEQTGKTKTIMPASACGACEFFEECPVKQTREGYRLEHTAKARRLAGRRREEAAEVFRERYRIRSGIEGTNSGLKRRTGLGRLRELYPSG